MKGLTKFSLIVSILSILILAACSLPGAASTKVIPNTGALQTAASTESPAGTVTSNPADAATTASQAPITHTNIPGDPVYSPDQIAVDCNTGARIAQGSNQVVITGCDYWDREMLERPADSATGTYVPALDILWSQTGKYLPWIFLKIKVTSLAQMPQGFQAAFELDTNLDSRGDFLLLANHPTSTDWTTEGVQVWQDANHDNGGQTAFHYDQNNGNGYETKLFDNGVGSDPDMAWVRISPQNPDTIEFALKADVLTNQNVFGWWAWTGTSNLVPAKFEVVDHTQDAQTWNIDNSCSWIFGTSPKSGQLVNLCAVIPPTPTPAPTGVSSGGNSCQVTPCRLGLYFDTASCSCKPFILFIPTATPIILR